jgi:hypothetical protein
VEDIGDGGHVVGALDDHPVRWTPRTDGTWARETLLDTSGTATAVNTQGDAVGYSGDDQLNPARFWPAGSTTGRTLAGLPGGSPDDVEDAAGVNDAGTIAGTVYAGDGTGRSIPVRWSAATAAAEPLETDGFPSAYVSLLNQEGTIAGAADTDDGRHILIWDH